MTQNYASPKNVFNLFWGYNKQGCTFINNFANTRAILFSRASAAATPSRKAVTYEPHMDIFREMEWEADASWQLRDPRRNYGVYMVVMGSISLLRDLI